MLINSGNSLLPTHGFVMEPRANWPQSLYGQNSTSLLQNDGMVSIPPNFGNTSAPNYLILGRSYCDSLKPIFLDSSTTHGRIDGGRSSSTAAQIGNCVDSFGRSLRDLDQTCPHLGNFLKMQMTTPYMSSSSFGAWQNARQDMKEYLNRLLPGIQDYIIDDFNFQLMSNAASIGEYLDQNTLLARVKQITDSKSLPPPSYGMRADNYDSGNNGFMEPMDNWPPHSNYHGQDSTSLLQNDGMVPPNFGNTTALQQQQPNYSFEGQFGSMGRSYCDPQMPISFDSSTHGRSSSGGTQVGNSVGNRWCISLDDHAQGVKTVKLKTDGAYQSESLSPVQTPHSSITQEVNQVLSLKFHYDTYYPQPLQQTQRTTRSANCGVTPHSNGVSGTSRYTGCESKCEYCGKNAPPVDYFLKRTVGSFRDQYRKSCKKLVQGSKYQHSVNCLLDGFKELQISQKIAPHSLSSIKSTQDISDGGDFTHKTMRSCCGYQMLFFLNRSTYRGSDDDCSTNGRSDVGTTSRLQQPLQQTPRTKCEFKQVAYMMKTPFTQFKNPNYCQNDVGYRFMKGKPRWYKLTLTYYIEPTVPPDADVIFLRGLKCWGDHIGFQFRKAVFRDQTDIIFAFGKTSSSDCLAQTTPPPNACVTLKSDENWWYGRESEVHVIKWVDFETVVVHELGHVFGLDHVRRDIKESVMVEVAPKPGQARRHLFPIDVQAIRSLYNV